LYEDGFTIAGARKRLSAGAVSGLQAREAAKPSRRGRIKDLPKPGPPRASEPLSKVKSELENILTLLDRE
jgi:hypothetical protein